MSGRNIYELYSVYNTLSYTNAHSLALISYLTAPVYQVVYNMYPFTIINQADLSV